MTNCDLDRLGSLLVKTLMFLGETKIAGMPVSVVMSTEMFNV
jgi:hypothetical protein